MAEAKSEGSAYAPVRNRAFKRGIENIRSLSAARGDDGYDVVVSRHYGIHTTATLHPRFGDGRLAGKGRFGNAVGTLMWNLRDGHVEMLRVHPDHRVGGAAHLISKAADYSDKAGMTGPIYGNMVSAKLGETLSRHGLDKPFDGDESEPCPHCGK